MHATKKAAAKSKSKAKTKIEDPEDDVVNFRKAEFVAAVAEKTGMTKGDSEKALSAVLHIIASVSEICCSLHRSNDDHAVRVDKYLIVV